jgi:hypothetical protein
METLILVQTLACCPSPHSNGELVKHCIARYIFMPWIKLSYLGNQSSVQNNRLWRRSEYTIYRKETIHYTCNNTDNTLSGENYNKYCIDKNGGHEWWLSSTSFPLCNHSHPVFSRKEQFHHQVRELTCVPFCCFCSCLVRLGLTDWKLSNK